MTEVERLLWAILCQLKAVGLHFRKQAPFGRYILDFVCHTAKLVVEVDGSQHALPEAIQHDEKRTAFLESRGYFVLRFWNADVIADRGGVSDTIYAIAKTSHHLRAAVLKSNSPPLPPSGEIDAPGHLHGAHHNERAGGKAPHPTQSATRLASTSPQGGGEAEDVS